MKDSKNCQEKKIISKPIYYRCLSKSAWILHGHKRQKKYVFLGINVINLNALDQSYPEFANLGLIPYQNISQKIQKIRLLDKDFEEKFLEFKIGEYYQKKVKSAVKRIKNYSYKKFKTEKEPLYIIHKNIYSFVQKTLSVDISTLTKFTDSRTQSILDQESNYLCDQSKPLTRPKYFKRSYCR